MTRPPARGIVAALKRLSVKTLLLSGAALVFFFCILIWVILEVSASRTNRLVQSLVGHDAAIVDLCALSNLEMLDARRYEKDFLLNYREFGFEEARARYITLLTTEVSEMQVHLARIRALAAEPETDRLTRAIEGALERYRVGIEAMVEAHGARGQFDTGVYGAMRGEAHAMESLVRDSGSDALLARLLAVRRAEKDFIERTKDLDVAAVEVALGDFLGALPVARLGAGARRELRERAERYLAHFRRYVELSEEIRNIKRRYLKAVQEIEPLLEKLSTLSLGRLKTKQLATEESARIFRLPVAAIGGVLLAVTALLTLTIVVTVTRSVVECESFAERIAGGDLQSRLVPEGSNEFSSLATSLNSMAESLQAAAAAREATLAALWDSEERYRALVETSTDWIWEIDREGKHIYTNDRLRQILGIEAEDLLQRPATGFLHPDDAPRVEKLFAARVASGTGWNGVVLRWRHKDGSYRWLESSALPVRDAGGSLVGFRGIDRDITERRRLEEELVKTQKLEAIGTLAGGIAHDFNNLLQGLFGYLSLARINIERPAKAAEMLDSAEKALTLSVNLTTQLLTFAKGGLPVKVRLALPGILEDTARLALSGSPSHLRITVAPNLGAVNADPGQLAQVIQNLVVNASEAMPQGGTVEITAANELLAAGSNPLVPEGGEFVRIDVRDTGVGIAGPHLARIFDPYFTTKRQGSGLGLATSYSIVRAHGGFIDVNSRPGEGSVFTVYLPAASPEEAGTAPPAGERPQWSGRARVLVMDDEELVRDVARQMLATLGHTVTAVASGEEAIEAFRRAREEGAPFEVVVLDLTVKNGMGGEEAMRRLRELDPAVRAVVSSGYSDAAVVADYRAYGFSAHLNKPYRLDALNECLRSLLSPAPTSRAGG